MVKLPEGLEFPAGRKKGRYRVGRCLGVGAQGAVHAITDNCGREQPFVAKLARHPAQKAPPKRKKSQAEINVGSLHSEYQYYQFHFRDFRTSDRVIPSLPPTRDGDVPAYGDIACPDGPDFRFLTLERMESPFFGAVDALLSCSSSSSQNKTKAKIIDIGPICARMVEILQLFHEKGYVFLDIKPDNFMLAPSTTATKKKKKKSSNSTAVSEELASRIRWLDLAMVQRLQDLYGAHVENEKSSKVQGTPLYCSLHVHEYNKPTRRDDLFAIGLVLSEFVIRIRAGIDGDDDQYAGTDPPSYLPWASERSDDDVGRVKRDEVLDRNSVFYRRMGSPHIADTMHQFLCDANDLEFKKKPQYDDYISLVSNLEVPVTDSKKRSTTTTKKKAAAAGTRKTRTTAEATAAAAAGARKKGGKTAPYTAEFAAAAKKKKSPSRQKATATSTRRSGRLKRDHESDPEDDDDYHDRDDDVSPPANKAPKSFHAELDDVNMEYIDDSDSDKSDDDDDQVDPMDIDDDEVEEVKPRNKKKPAPAAAAKKKKKNDCGIKLSVVQGPDKGKSIIILKKSGSGSKPKDVVVGTKPANVRKNEVAFQLTAAAKDKTIGKSHAKLKGIFGSREPSCSVEVTDLSSSGGATFLDGKQLASGGKKTIHRCSTIRLGSATTIQVSWWSGSSDKENVA